MNKLDNDKHPFDKKTLVKLAPAAVVIAAVAAAGVQAKGEITNTAAEAKNIVKSQDITSLLNTAYFSEETETEGTKENSVTTAKAASKNESTKKKSSSKKTSKKTTKTSKKKTGGIKKGSVKTLPTKTAAASGQGQGTTTTPTTEVPEGGYKDGVYQGSGTGFGGTITVQVTVSGGQITAVDILSAAGETGSYFSSARGVISEVLSSQSPNVDAISGATYSSNGIIQAVQNALSQAGSAGSTEATPTPTPSPKPTKTPKPGKTDTNVTYKDGVYGGEAEGFDGTVTVKVTIKKGKIKKITNTNTDTAEFFNKAWKSIKAEVISRQSVAGIDTVSGATFSSNGILGAVSQALAKAQESGNTGDNTTDGTNNGTNDGTNDGNNSSDPENTVTPIPTQTPGADENPGDSDNPSDTPQTPENPSDPGPLLKDGVYTASAQGYSGDVVITITVKDGKITEITNTNTDTRTFFNKAWRRLQPKILEKQDTEGIDTVSGATFSSQGILNASKLAIEQAKNTEEPTPTVTPEPSQTPEATPTPEPTQTPEATPTVTPEPTKTPEETPTPEPTKAPEPTATPEPPQTPEETPTPEPTQTPASEYKDGTYTGIGEGNDGPDSVQVTITIQDGKIINAVYNTYDDEDFFEPAWEGILSQVIGKQSAEGIDTVSGSTYSSLGIIKAFQEALKQAKGV